MEKIPESVKGYPKLAVLFGLLPQVACYRKFSSLTNRILAYHQARLTRLELRLRDLELADSFSQEGDRQRYSRDWTFLVDSGAEGHGEQWEVVCEIRGVISEYYDLLLKHIKVTGIPPPESFDLKFFQEWLQRPDRGENALSGEDVSVYGTPGDPDSRAASDLAVVEGRPDAGPFLNWVVGSFTTFVHRRVVEPLTRLKCLKWLKIKTISSEHNEYLYNSKLVTGARIVSAAIPSLLLCMTVAILYFVNSTIKRLGLVACFCVIYSFCLSYFTRPQGAEIFSSVSTFAAIAVVFVAASPPNGNATAMA